MFSSTAIVITLQDRDTSMLLHWKSYSTRSAPVILLVLLEISDYTI